MQILELEGFKAVGACNGVEAMDYLHTSDLPCLIILDLLMPAMNGKQFRAALLNVVDLDKIPVVVVSALDISTVSDLGVVRAFRTTRPRELLILARTVPGSSAWRSCFRLAIEPWQNGIDKSVLHELHQRLPSADIRVV